MAAAKQEGPADRHARRAAFVDSCRGEPGPLRHLNLKASMQRVLAILGRHHGVLRGMVTLLREASSTWRRRGLEDRAKSVRYGSGRASPARWSKRQADRRPRVSRGAACSTGRPRGEASVRSSASSACRSCLRAPRSARLPLTCASSRSATSTAASSSRHRQLDDRAGAQRAAPGRGDGGGCRREHTPRQDCASATTSPTSSVRAARPADVRAGRAGRADHTTVLIAASRGRARR